MSGLAAREPQSRLDALQALRALAAGLVVLDHAAASHFEHVHPGVPVPEAIWFAGALGVKLFFGISGYIICLSTRSLPPGGAGVLDFFRRRLIRVVPLYWLATLAYGLRLMGKGEAPTPPQWLMSLGFIPYANEAGQMRPIVGVGWSLNFEMFFYLVMGLCLFLPRRWSAWATFGLLGAAWLGSLFIGAPASVPPHEARFALLIDPVLGYFLSGVALASLPARVRTCLPSGGLGFGATVAAACLPVLLLLGAVWFGGLSSHHGDLVAPALCALALGLCVLERPSSPQAGGWWRGLLVRAGDASYSTYIVHTFLLTGLWALGERLLGPALRQLPMTAYAVVILLIGTGAGWAVYRWIEQPMMRWLQRRFPGPRRGLASAVRASGH